MTTLARRALRNARLLVGGRVCAQATRGVYVLLLARSLDAAAYGSLAFAQASYLGWAGYALVEPTRAGVAWAVLATAAAVLAGRLARASGMDARPIAVTGRLTGEP